jgi:hypothetical protein
MILSILNINALSKARCKTRLEIKNESLQQINKGLFLIIVRRFYAVMMMIM